MVPGCTSLHVKEQCLDLGEQKHLTMLNTNGDKIRTAYNNLMDCKSHNMTGKMCWPVDWFPEPLPIENSAGTAMFYGLEYEVAPSQTFDGQWPPVDATTAEPMNILCFTDGYGYCKEMFEQAPPGRIGMLKVESKPPSSYDEKGVKQLIKAASWDMLVFAVGIDPAQDKTAKAYHDAQDAVLKLYFYILKAVSDSEGQVKKIAIITCDTFAEEPEIHEEMGISIITHATLFGMTNTARAEIPLVPFQYIDTEWSLLSENSKILSSEIFRDSSFGHNSVRILNRGRYVLRTVDGTKYEHKELFAIPDNGVISITGGNGALGLVMGKWILERCEAEGGKSDLKIEFCSRSAKIKDNNLLTLWDDCQKLAAKMRIRIEHVKVDFSKEENAHQYIRDQRGRLKGIIHSAGVLADGMLFNQSWQKFDTCFEAKSRAAFYIHEALQQSENPIEFFWLFSSESVYGNMGQLNYSASNSWLDALARHRRALGLPAMCPQWGAWGDVGMASNLNELTRRRMNASPFPYFSNAEGLQGLEQLIKTGLPYGQIMKCNAPVLFGTIMGEDTVAQCHQRNFYSEIAPPPPGDKDRNPYNTFTYEYRSKCHVLKNALAMKAYCGSIWKEYEMDDC